MDLVAFSFDVQDEGSGLPLDVALQVVVVLELELRSEGNLNWEV